MLLLIKMIHISNIIEYMENSEVSIENYSRREKKKNSISPLIYYFTESTSYIKQICVVIYLYI